MLSPLHDLRRYACPEEPGEISRANHLARLAASYPKCGSCPHRHDTGLFALPSLATRTQDSPVVTETLRKTANGVRGVYVNQLDRKASITWAMALGSLLWEDHAVSLNEANSRPKVPTVVIGYDERPSAPDLLMGVAIGLQRMSCQVIDIGLTTEPCLAFAVQHLQGAAGLYVTGSGCDPAWIGFDLRRQHGLPPDPEFLQRWFLKQEETISRPSRLGGSLRSFSPTDSYETNLWKHYHALRPLRVVAGTASQQLSTRFTRVFSRLSGQLDTVHLPLRRRDLGNPHDADVQRLSEKIRAQSAHLGVIIDDDGMSCCFLDELGQLIEAPLLCALLARHTLLDHGGGDVLITPELWDRLAPVITAHGGQPQLVAAADRATRLLVSDGLLALGVDHKYWICSELPTCDAIVTLAVVMQALSLSDTDCSTVLDSLR